MNVRIATLLAFLCVAPLRAGAQRTSEFCRGFAEAWKAELGEYRVVPVCPVEPVTSVGSTPFREGIKAGTSAAQRSRDRNKPLAVDDAVYSSTGRTTSTRPPSLGVFGALAAVRDKQLAREKAEAEEQARLEDRLAAMQTAKDQRRSDSLRVVLDSLERKRAAEARVDAQWNAFLPRARFVMESALDTVPVFDSVATAFWNDASKAMDALWAVDREASNAKMSDAIAPVVADYMGRYRAFIARAKSALQGMADSLKLTTAERPVFIRAGGDRVLPLGDKSLEVSAACIRQAIQPVVDSVLAKRSKVPGARGQGRVAPLSSAEGIFSSLIDNCR